MKKSFMSNIMNFVDSNVRQRIDRAAHNNNEFFSDELLILERHFEDIRLVCIEAEKRISTMLQSIQSTPSLGAYTQNVQVGLNNLSQNIAHVATGSSSSVAQQTQTLPVQPATVGGALANINSNLKNVQQATNSTLANNKNLVTARAELSSISKPSTSEQAMRASQASRSTDYDDVSNTTNGSHLVCNSPIDLIDPALQLTNDILHHRHRKLPIVGFLKFLAKSCHKLKQDSLLATTLTHCSQLQLQLTKLYLAYEQTIELQCLKPVQHMLEIDIPNVVKLRKLFIKSHNDLESLKAKYNGASQKQQQQYHQQQASNSYTIAQTSAQQSNINKLDLLKKELDDGVTRFEQARDSYEAELYSLVCRESELVDLLRSLYKYQAEYNQQVVDTIQGSLPALDNILVHTPRKPVFGTQLDEHLRCTGQVVSPVIELCTHLLYSHGLKEEGLFRIPGSSVKIKKLKNAINAWFVTLASRQELESDQQRKSGHSNIVALYDMFKNILGNGRSISLDLHILPSSNDDSTLTKNNVCNNAPTTEDHDKLSFDLHSIAGLLKLYLRELPQPLISHSLYDEWVGSVSMNTDEAKITALTKVIERMPRTNYDNLRHLIRFLHLLTCQREYNKMSSSNLAITMAPSLLWSKPVMPVHSNQQHQLVSSDLTTSSSIFGAACDSNSPDDANSMNLQMSSIGMSASLHALVLEALINHAESLFPGQVDFTLPGFKDLNTNSGGHNQQRLQLLSSSSLLSKNRDRSVKSTSPTGISTASSSSFSSNASTSTTSSAKTKTKSHSRKSGSMDGLLNHTQTPAATMTGPSETETTSSIRSGSIATSRPMSVHLQGKEYRPSTANRNQPPPVPPVPLGRSYAMQSASHHHQSVHGAPTTRLNLKPPAPPVPKQSAVSSTLVHKYDNNDNNNTPDQQKPRAASLRGTGTLASAPSTTCPSSASNSGSSNLNSVRPTVPPPDRPTNLSPIHHLRQQSSRGDENTFSSALPNQKEVTSTTIRGDCDSKSLNCVTSSGVGLDGCQSENFEGDANVDVIRPDSQAVWPDSNSGDDEEGARDEDDDDDSSFDDNQQQHRHESPPPVHSSGPECGLTTSGTGPFSSVGTCNKQQTSSHMTTTITTSGALNQALPRTSKPPAPSTSSVNVVEEPPVKPPRSISPKITQSTPL